MHISLYPDKVGALQIQVFYSAFHARTKINTYVGGKTKRLYKANAHLVEHFTQSIIRYQFPMFKVNNEQKLLFYIGYIGNYILQFFVYI